MGAAKRIVRNWLIPLKHASAAEVANTIREAYREYMNGDAISATVGGFRGFGFARVAQSLNNVDANGKYLSGAPHGSSTQQTAHPGVYELTWGDAFKGFCAPIVSVDSTSSSNRMDSASSRASATACE